MKFGDNLKQAITIRGYDIDEVAIQVDVEAATLYGYAENLYYPQFDNLCAICNHFLIPPNELFMGLFDIKETEATYTARIISLLDSLKGDQKKKADQMLAVFDRRLRHNEVKDLGSRVKWLREYYDLTAPKLGAQIHLAPSTIRNIETNYAQPSVSSLLALANIFKVSPNYLLNERVNVPSAKRFSYFLPNEIVLLYETLSICFRKS